MTDFLEIHLKLYYNLTRCAKLSTMLVASERVLPIIEKSSKQENIEIYDWFSKAINATWQWISNRKITVRNFYENYIDDKIGHYSLEENQQETGAFNTCIDAILYSAEVMYNLSNSTDIQDLPIPSIIADTDYLITIECLEWAVKASDDEQAELAWQEKVIHQLLKNHYTEEFDALGELIGREYFEPFL